jgi:hypothetical protein
MVSAVQQKKQQSKTPARVEKRKPVRGRDPGVRLLNLSESGVAVAMALG